MNEVALRSLASLGERAPSLLAAVHELSRDELLWLSGYTAGLAARPASDVASRPTPASTPLTNAGPADAVTVIYGTHTGHSRALAERLAARLEAGGAAVRLWRASDYPLRELARERTLFVVVATHGDGDPADDTRALWDHLTGRRAPRLPELRYAVLGLGDSSYPRFCHVARVLDERLAELGAERLHPRGECDVEVEVVAAPWLDATVALGLAAVPRRSDGVVIPLHGASPPALAPPARAATRAQPALATVVASQPITGRGAVKRVHHLELAIDEAVLGYQPGDALAILPSNPPALVDEVVELLGGERDQVLTREGRALPLATWLTDELELTRVARPFLAAHLARSRDAGALGAALAPGAEAALAAFVAEHQVVDVLRRFPAEWSAAELVAALRPLSPRSYSIASALTACPGELHLTVAEVAAVRDGRPRVGCASDYLARLPVGATVRAHVEPTPGFRLPADDVDLIFVGPGTGVAPFRAFLQAREAAGARGRSWLFFGAPHRRSQFLYQLEWQRALAQRRLTRLDVAFSRDQPERVYVQDRLRARGAEVHAWLAGGAHLYVCGDARHMAPAVDAALRAIAAAHGGLGEDAAAAWLSELAAAGRYHRDVY